MKLRLGRNETMEKMMTLSFSISPKDLQMFLIAFILTSVFFIMDSWIDLSLFIFEVMWCNFFKGGQVKIPLDNKCLEQKSNDKFADSMLFSLIFSSIALQCKKTNLTFLNLSVSKFPLEWHSFTKLVKEVVEAKWRFSPTISPRDLQTWQARAGIGEERWQNIFSLSFLNRNNLLIFLFVRKSFLIVFVSCNQVKTSLSSSFLSHSSSFSCKRSTATSKGRHASLSKGITTSTKHGFNTKSRHCFWLSQEFLDLFAPLSFWFLFDLFFLPTVCLLEDMVVC